MNISLFLMMLPIIGWIWFGIGMNARERGAEAGVMRIPVRLIAIAFVISLVIWFLRTWGIFATVILALRDQAIGLLAGAVAQVLLKGTVKIHLGLGITALLPWIVYLIITYGVGGLLQQLPRWLESDGGLSNPGSHCYRKVSAANATEDTATLLVELGDDDTIEELDRLLNQYHFTAKRAFTNISKEEDIDLFQTYLLTGPAEHVETILKAMHEDDENVDFAEKNSVVKCIPTIPGKISIQKKPIIANDPEINNQWYLHSIEAASAFVMLSQYRPAKKATIAILDTGVDANHEDIKDVFSGTTGNTDTHGHGSHCAGLAGAITNNSVGMASLNWEGNFVNISSYSALDKNGVGSVESVAQAIINAAQAGVDVISMSLGSYHPIPPRAESEAVGYALSKGCIVVVAAGNDNDDAKNHAPANIPGVITVAALDENGKKADFSNWNTSLAMPIAAPGVNILSLKTGGNYVAMSGTSMATPIVAGLCGVLRAIRPNISAKEIFTLLNQTGINHPDAAKTGKAIDAAAAIKTVLNAI